MLTSVGPQMVGATDLKSTPLKAIEKDFKGSSSDSSFGKALQDKMSLNSSKDPKDLKDPKETKESPKQETKAKDQNEKNDDQPTTPDEKRAEQKVAKPDGTPKRKTANRQQAIKEFMDSFESEFEIPPTRLVEAMAKLDESQLKESPEKTADAVIEQLGLDDTQADKARAMYVSLLMQLQQQPAQKTLKEMSAGLGTSVSHQGMQMRQAAALERQNIMGSAVENLNKKFWMTKEQPATAAMPDLNGNLAQKLMMDESMMNSADTSAAPAMDDVTEGSMAQAPQAPVGNLDKLPPHLQGQMKDTMSPALLAALAAKKAAAAQQSGVSAEDASEESTDLSEEFQQALEAPRGPNASQDPQMKNAVQAKLGAQEFFQQQNESQGQSLMQNSKEFMQQGMSHEKDASKGKLTAKSAEFKTALTGLEGLQAQPLKGEALKFDPAGAAMAPVAPGQMKPAENEAAVKQLMNQAQYLIKKGGGEVKVEMTPEGMGTIHLKVMLQDGKVNLQMSADTQEAKKTIESSLAELKTSLAAHKLSVENVKVDVVNSTSTDNTAQNQTNMNGQGQQREARQFWNQFNENFGNQGRREALTDFQNIKGYGGKRRDPLQPIETSSVQSTARTVSGKGSGLNLVA